MKTNVEKQVAAFDQVLGHCNALGPMYNPSKASMKVAALNAMLTSARQSIQAADTANSALIVAINARKQAFSPLAKTGTRILNALAATDASPELVADIKAYRDKFRSPVVRKKKVTPQDGIVAQPNSASTSRGPISQLDFESQITNVGMIIRLLQSEPTYKPAEPDLTIAGLTMLLNTLEDRHNAVAVAQMAMKHARRDRKKAVYDVSGIAGTAQNLKKYVLSVFGATSAEYRTINSYRFVIKR